MEFKLKIFRINAGFSLQEMANMLHVGKSTISRWEREEVAIPEDMFEQYCSICKIDKSLKSKIIKRTKLRNRRELKEENDTRDKNSMLS